MSKIQSVYTVIYIIVVQMNAFNNPKCRGKRYMCAPPDLPNQEGVCINVTDFREKLHYITPCPTEGANTYCPWQNTSFGQPANCTTQPLPDPKIPGEACNSNSECFSGICTDSLCKGLALNFVCNSHIDCGIGLYCSLRKLCEEQKDFNEACSSDYDCVNNCACNLGKCAYYYSFDVSIPADNPVACASGYVKDGVCAKERKSLYKGRPCDSNQDCGLVNDKKEVIGYSECECGYNGGGFTYCSLAEGDDEFKEAVNKFQFVLFRSYGCHTLLRFGPCQKIFDDEYLEYQEAITKYQMYSQIVFNDECIRKTYTWDYWKIKAAQQALTANILSFIYSVFMLIMSLLVVIGL